MRPFRRALFALTSCAALMTLMGSTGPEVSASEAVFDFAPVGDDTWRSAAGTFAAAGASLDAGPHPIHLATVGLGRPDAMRSIALGELALVDAPPIGDRPGLVQRGDGVAAYWLARPDGAQLAWTLDAPPPGAGPVRVRVATDAHRVHVPPAGRRAVLVGAAGQVLRVGGLDAWDAHGVHLPIRLLADGDALEVEVDDRGAAYPITIDPVYASADDAVLYTDIHHPMPVGVFGDPATGGTRLLVLRGLNPRERWVYDHPIEDGVVAPSAARVTALHEGIPNLEGTSRFRDIVFGDFDADGWVDLAIGDPSWSWPADVALPCGLTSRSDHGTIYLFRGSADGFVAAGRLENPPLEAPDPLCPTRYWEGWGGQLLAMNVDGLPGDELIVTQFRPRAYNETELRNTVVFRVLGPETNLGVLAPIPGDPHFGPYSGQRAVLDLGPGPEGEPRVGLHHVARSISEDRPTSLYVYDEVGEQSISAPRLLLETPLTLGAGARAAGDVTGDGLPDLAVSWDYVAPTYGRGLAVLPGTPDGGYGAPEVWIGPGQTLTVGIDLAPSRLVFLGDVNGDGAGDLILVTLNGGSHRPYVLTGGAAAPTADRLFWMNSPTDAPWLTGQVEAGDGVVSVGDIDADGAPDFAIGTYGFSQSLVSIYYGLAPACPDADDDGVCDDEDGCPFVYDPDQADLDGDGVGDACDPDLDGDGVPNEVDNCPATPNPGQSELDGDGVGDACDLCFGDDAAGDSDDDGVCDDLDPCWGDNTSGDSDSDGVCDDVDVCPLTVDPEQHDSDGDGVGDACDPCPDAPSCPPLCPGDPACPPDEVCVDDALGASSQDTAFLLGPGLYADLALCDADDWYLLDLEAGALVTIDVLFTHAEGDIDVALYTPTGSRLAAGESTTDNEQIALTAPTTGVYAVHVYLWADDGVLPGNTYTLAIAVAPPPVCPGDPSCPPVCPGDPSCPPVCPGDPSCPPVCPGDPSCPPPPPPLECVEDDLDASDPADAFLLGPGWYSGLALCAPNVDDWFLFELAPGDQLTVDAYFNHAQGDIDLDLFASDGGLPIRSSASSDDDDGYEVILYGSPAGGTYALRVRLSEDAGDQPGNTYTLAVFIDPSQPPPVCPGDPSCPPPPECPGDPSCPPPPPVCPGDPACPPPPPPPACVNDTIAGSGPLDAPVIESTTLTGLTLCPDEGSDWFGVPVNAGDTLVALLDAGAGIGALELLLTTPTLDVAAQGVTVTPSGKGLAVEVTESGTWFLVVLAPDAVPSAGQPYVLHVLVEPGEVAPPCPDADGDGICDVDDNCADDPNADQADADEDGAGDACDACWGDDLWGDSDGDGVCDDLDQCFGDDAWGDSDDDGVCDDLDVCLGDDAWGDSDGDGVCDDLDACLGDDATGDSDDDGVCDDLDQCWGDDATGDSDADGVCDDLDLCLGDDAWGDSDGDGVCDDLDACLGDDATGDSDADGVCDDLDQCFGDDATGDSDADGVCDNLDLCFGDDATGDSDADGVCDDLDLCLGDDATGDTDADGVCDAADNCPNDANPGQADADGDGIGDVCEADTDTDGVIDDDDNCPDDFNPDQADSDGDGVGDVCDDDDDGDGVPDFVDNCPLEFNPDQADFDGDGVGDACDGDTDGDGVWDDEDVCPMTSVGVVVDASGCSGHQLVESEAGDVCDHANQGSYVGAVNRAANTARRLGLLSNSERAAIVRDAARTRCD